MTTRTHPLTPTSRNYMHTYVTDRVQLIIDLSMNLKQYHSYVSVCRKQLLLSDKFHNEDIVISGESVSSFFVYVDMILT